MRTALHRWLVRTALHRWFEQHIWAGDAVLGVLMLVALGINALDYRYTEPALVPFLLISVIPMFLRRSSPEWALILGPGLLLINLRLVGSANVAVVLAPVLVHAGVAQFGDVHLVDERTAGGDGVQPGQAVHQGGFARTRRAHHRGERR